MNLTTSFTFLVNTISLLLALAGTACGSEHHDHHHHSHAHGRAAAAQDLKTNKTWEETPHALFSTFDEEVPLDMLARLGDACNHTAFKNTYYYRAWEKVNKEDLHSEAAELFNHFEKVTRKGRAKQWHQDRCDAWPISLMYCTVNNTCECFTKKTFKMTEFSSELRKFENGMRLQVCRVLYGKRCSLQVPALRCAHHYKCISGRCRGSWFQPSGQLIGYILALFITRYCFL